MQLFRTMTIHRHPIIKAALVAAALPLSPSCAQAAEPLVKPSFDTLFEPLLADPMQPHIAVMPKLDEQQLQLDIGTSVDLWQNERKDRAVGIDFATWSLLEREDGFKFPVDSIDYLFGVNATWKNKLESTPMGFDTMTTKVRVSHISAHFEDGHTNPDGSWLHPELTPTNEIPFTYSREFINVTTAFSATGGKVYLGYQYLFHTIPGDINRHSFQAGAEIGLPHHAYLAADFKLLPEWNNSLGKTDGFQGTWNLQAGMRLTSLGLDDVRVACSYFSGISRQGMYMNQSEEFTSLGVIVDL